MLVADQSGQNLQALDSRLSAPGNIMSVICYFIRSRDGFLARLMGLLAP